MINVQKFSHLKSQTPLRSFTVSNIGSWTTLNMVS